MAANDTTRYDKAIKRNLAELSNAILKRRALIGLHDAHSAHALDFFTIVNNALFNDIVSHAIKVFEDSTGVASFWYIEKTDQAAIKRAAKLAGIDITNIRSLCVGLEHIRNKTLFHIDRDAVLNPKRVWEDADVKGDDLGTLLDSAVNVLIHLYKEKTGKNFQVPDYDGSDVKEIIRSYVKNNPDVNILI